MSEENEMEKRSQKEKRGSRKGQQKKKNLEADVAKCFKLTNLFKINVTDAGNATQNPAASVTLAPSCSDNSQPAPNREEEERVLT